MLIRRAVVAVALCVCARAAAAQTQQVAVSFIPTARLALMGGNPSALQAGLGTRFPLSSEFSIGGTAGAGISSTGFSGRGDLFGQFSLDPYHQNTWEPYVGGGVTERLDAGGPGARTYLLGFIGANWPRSGSIAPGVELGFGGGVRLGVTLRWASK
ncbi:MAG: hypothetical protein ACR2MQ_15525 [Gemmatimonadaceae bacterium]